MGDPGGEAAQGGQMLGPGDFLLQGLKVRDVAEEDDGAQKFPLGAVQTGGDDFQGHGPAVGQRADHFPGDQLSAPGQNAGDFFTGRRQQGRGRPSRRRCLRDGQDGGGGLVEGRDHPPGIDGDEPHGHVFHEVGGEGLNLRQGFPRCFVSLGQQQGDDPGQTQKD